MINTIAFMFLQISCLLKESLKSNKTLIIFVRSTNTSMPDLYKVLT